ncbi:hypothetical protein TNCV_3504071 [Trichonephila clavipes]|uniref:Uncharacterized protein n=1 Tax=Trichonephila clavipes TaxID=2585209 RepID=A0A8X6V2T3_TRICX|nr:hypothetical protein TNCV_3504071 [Trichonephila clavipes]
MIFNIRIVSGFKYCMDRIQFSVIRRIAYPNGVRSQLIRINDVLLYVDAQNSYVIPCLNCGGEDRRNFSELNRTVTCMLLNAKANDRRTSQPLATMNFVGLDLTASDRWH